jgi:hypothetical protein
VASATSINKVAITAPATSATLTITDGKTLSVSNTLTLAGTDSTVMTFPGATDTVMGLGAIQTVTAAKTFADGKLVLAGATSGGSTLKAPAIASTYVHTLPAATTTLLGTDNTATLTNKTFDTAGTGNSFSINGTAVSAVTGTGAVVLAADPALTGNPTAPTQTVGNNSTRLATTAFVTAAVSAATAGVATFGSRTGTVTVPGGSFSADAVELLRYDAAQTLTATQKAQARANIDALKKNYILNGAMMVSQQNGTTAGTTSSYYPVDQFFVVFSNGGATSAAQVASATTGGSPNRLRVTATTADASVAAGDYAYVGQRIEGLRAADLLFGSASAKTITIQFGVKAPAGTYCVTVLNSATDRSYVAEYTISGGEANTDVVKSVTIAGDTSGTWLATSGIGLQIRWGLMCGATYQQAAASWSTASAVGSSNQFNLYGTINNVFELFDVSLTEGSDAPDFQVPDFASELMLCSRYYQKSFEYATAPAQNVGLTGSYICVPPTASAGAGSIKIPYLVKLRVAATTLTTYSTSAADANWWDTNASASRTVATADSSTNGFRCVVNATTTAASQHFIHWTAEARL